MNRHWCEGLDWIRVEDILDVDPDLYVQLLRNLQERLDFHPEGNKDTKKNVFLTAEIFRRIENKLVDDLQRDCIVEAMQLVAIDSKKDYERLVKVLQQNYGQRVVKGPDGKTKLVDGLKVVARDGGEVT
jgi:hypothetical protein